MAQSPSETSILIRSIESLSTDDNHLTSVTLDAELAAHHSSSTSLNEERRKAKRKRKSSSKGTIHTDQTPGQSGTPKSDKDGERIIKFKSVKSTASISNGCIVVSQDPIVYDVTMPHIVYILIVHHKVNYDSITNNDSSSHASKPHVANEAYMKLLRTEINLHKKVHSDFLKQSY